ncbi:thioredoxin [Geoglobus ahangari]|uniref:Thioredoxin n=1 Tax=Geoglobus ahangari TaxID=113653 RepID=A0A0F7DC36_9EURY|nr:thioredoxin family protein [Geoglobus ahangari]AKG92156.1 thioredoxin [Geoglobus ahangari]
MGLIDRILRKSRKTGVVPASAQTFDELLNSSRYVVVDFWGKRCPPCEAMEPIVERLAGEYDGRVLFLKVSVNSSPELAERCRVRSVPAFLFFENARLKGRRVGAMKYEHFKRWVDGLMEG